MRGSGKETRKMRGRGWGTDVPTMSLPNRKKILSIRPSFGNFGFTHEAGVYKGVRYYHQNAGVYTVYKGVRYYPQAGGDEFGNNQINDGPKASWCLFRFSVGLSR